MLVCEKEFDFEDRNHKGYSLAELDMYAWIPYDKATLTGVQNHRLSIWKNLITNEFEVYRAYNQPWIGNNKNMTIFTNHETGEIEVIFRSKSLRETLNIADNEVEKYHQHRDMDELCEHKYPKKATLCPVGKYENSNP